MRFIHFIATAMTMGYSVAAPRDGMDDRSSGRFGYGDCEIPRLTPHLSDVWGTDLAQYLERSDGIGYRYLHVRPQNESLPYILFLHGFPSSFYDWRHQIRFFAERGYGIVAPDLLGYGGTDKPTDPAAYRLKHMSQEVVRILDCEGIQTVFGVGHDWGSPLLSRMANYFPSRFNSYTFIDVGYSDPTTNLDRQTIENLNQQSIETSGFAPFGYFEFLASAGATELINSHFDSAFTLSYTSEYETRWKTDLGPSGAFERWLKENRTAPLGDWITEEDVEIHRRIFIGNGGYGGPLNWYTAAYFGFNAADDAAISPERATLNEPVLLIGATRNPFVGAEAAEASTRLFAPNFRAERLSTGHWIHLEARDQTNAILQSFFHEVMAQNV